MTPVSGGYPPPKYEADIAAVLPCVKDKVERKLKFKDPEIAAPYLLLPVFPILEAMF